MCGCARTETWKVLPEWFAFHKLAWFQLTFLLAEFLYSITHLPVHIQPWQNRLTKDHGSKIIILMIIIIIIKTLRSWECSEFFAYVYCRDCVILYIHSFIHFILFTRSTFGGAALRYRTRQYKIKYPRGQRHKIQSM
jgi:hypothetical protein